ncbi:TetR/AcrR family transcriptional regulator [Bacillus badius]|uniref:Transcriptional regulator, TetR family n=1 Tax=Bacillus badius TaxID=1455 RepID=A0ABR5B105_BACBA|nr:TetR/AcrR family transcriptional regulator [Bacillus badius]KIL73668.1 Transcriptional regulator, TetR family [Bacillus badius]KIL80676.1 Transcriptional regulator, TetR family [Bacillus badius]KZO01754.1 TetR family transcriptional regulator [Bacillus badius]KZR59406.1 TetR family transcriptional regulator [Bacillus badius]MED0667415.1 TetR/AcrR family transcriptional regulator [Bacillus badius]
MKKKPLKERILETSLVMFEKHGYHGVTVDQIVAECGTSKGGFYHNFKSKDELLYHIHDIFISYVLDRAKQAYADYSTPVSRLCAVILSFTKVFDLYKPHITVFYQESTYLKGDFQEKINEKRDEYRKIILQIIQEGQKSGDFRPEVSAEITTMAIIGMVNWTYKWFKKEGELSIEEIGGIFNDLLVHALVTKQGMEHQDIQAYLLNSQPVNN